MASTTTSSSGSLDRKSLRRTDAFSQAVKGFFDAANANAGASLAVLGVLFAVGLASAIYMNHQAEHAVEAREALFKARQSLDSGLKAMAPAKTTTARDAAAKDPKNEKDAKAAQKEEADEAAAVAALQYKKLDVDAQLGEGVKKLQAVSDEYQGTRAAYEARLSLGDAYYQHGQPDKALPWYQRAVDSAPNSFEKTLSLTALGYAYENSGKAAEAASTYEKALSQGEAGLKGDLLMALARTQAKTGDKAKARTTYDQVLAQLPNTEQAKLAESLKAKLDQ